MVSWGFGQWVEACRCVIGLARRGSAVGFRLLWRTVELTVGVRLCLSRWFIWFWCVGWVVGISILWVASGARGGVGWLWGCFAPPPPHSPPSVVCSADRFGAVVLVLFLFLVALCSCVVPALLSVVVVVFLLLFFVLFWGFFFICVVLLAFWSPSSIAAHFAFCFTNCVVMLTVWWPSTAAHFAFCFTSCD